MKFSTRLYVVLFSALVLIAMSAGAGNGGVKYDAIEKGPTAAESVPQTSNGDAVEAQNAQIVIENSIVGVIKVAATYAIGSNKLLPISTKAVNSGFQLTPDRGSWGYALVKGPAAIHSLGDERLWHQIEVPVDEWVILVSWGRQFTIETTDAVIAASSSMAEEVNATLLNNWSDVLGGNAIPWKYYELRENGNFLETRLGGW